MVFMLNQKHFRYPGPRSCIPEPFRYFNQMIVLHNKFTRGIPVYEKRETCLLVPFSIPLPPSFIYDGRAMHCWLGGGGVDTVACRWHVPHNIIV